MKNLKNALLLKKLYLLKQLGYRYTSIRPYVEGEPNLILPNSLESVKKQAYACHLCDLSKSRHKVVFGEGNANASIMFIGDLPSTSDDSSGKIFTGRAGELLKNMIEKVLEVERKNVYITNLLKCRVHDNQSPSPRHTHTCHPYLLKEIELINPQIIVTLGQLAYEYISNTTEAIEKVHGIVHTMNDITMIPMYHPNYLLRNPSSKKEAWEDLLKIKTYLKT